MRVDKFCPLFIFSSAKEKHVLEDKDMQCKKIHEKLGTCEVGRTNYNLLLWSDHDCQTIGATDTPPTTINDIIGILITISKHITNAKQNKII